MSNTTLHECNAPDIDPAEIGTVVSATEPPPITKPFKRTLQCELTEAEIIDIAKKAMEAQREIDRLTEDRRASAAEYAERIKRRTVERNVLMQDFSSRSVCRVVDCEWWLNYPEAGMKTAIRLDTGDAIGAESMTTEDFDQELPGIVEPEAAPAEEAGAVEDGLPEEDGEEDVASDAEEIAENARVDAIIDGLKDDEPEGDF